MSYKIKSIKNEPHVIKYKIFSTIVVKKCYWKGKFNANNKAIKMK